MRITKEVGNTPVPFVPYKIIFEINDAKTQWLLFKLFSALYDLVNVSSSKSADGLSQFPSLYLLRALKEMLSNRDPSSKEVTL